MIVSVCSVLYHFLSPFQWPCSYFLKFRILSQNNKLKDWTVKLTRYSIRGSDALLLRTANLERKTKTEHEIKIRLSADFELFLFFSYKTNRKRKHAVRFYRLYEWVNNKNTRFNRLAMGMGREPMRNSKGEKMIERLMKEALILMNTNCLSPKTFSTLVISI